MTLSEYQGNTIAEATEIDFPPYGKTDADIFENNLLEVMQFVFNHTSFDPNNNLDKEILTAYAKFGVEPGNEFTPKDVVKIDGEKFRNISLKIKDEELKKFNNPEEMKEISTTMFLAKGSAGLESLLLPSVVGPIGQPAKEALYLAIVSDDGAPMYDLSDYVIRMTKEELPPANAFWSLTLYDAKEGFFIPNEQKKYSVGENGGMKLNKDGGIEIYIAANKPQGVPKENWLPINGENIEINAMLRLYAPDLEKMKTWKVPSAVKIE
jgi:hypothetical protein